MEELRIEIELKRYKVSAISNTNLNELSVSYDELFDDYGGCEGKFLIYFQRNLSNEIEDEIPALVKNICFDSIETLIQGKSYVYRYFSQYGYVRLDPEGSKILISGDGLNTIRYPLEDFIKELFNCGLMFLKVLETLAEVSTNNKDKNENTINQQNLSSLIALLTESKNKAEIFMTKL
jgi:hypothetical protein